MKRERESVRAALLHARQEFFEAWLYEQAASFRGRVLKCKFARYRFIDRKQERVSPGTRKKKRERRKARDNVVILN